MRSTESDVTADTYSSGSEEAKQIALLFKRASQSTASGQYEDAKRNYLAILAIDPCHFGALNDLGNTLYRTDFRTAACSAYAQAVRVHPNNVIGRVNYANALMGSGDYTAAGVELDVALRLAPDNAEVHRSMSHLLQNLGDWEEAEEHRQKSYRPAELRFEPYVGSGIPCWVLVLISAVGGNIPTRLLLDNQRFEVTTLVVEGFDTTRPLPPHDVVFNAVGDADICMTALDAVDRVLTLTQATVVNPPDRIRPTDRIANANRVRHLPHVRAPRMALVERSAVAEQAEIFGYPLLLRTPGYHTGRYFQKVDRAADIEAAMAELPGEQLLAIEYLDARDADGFARKYRVMMIGGELLPLHMAASQQWMVHYFTADMADHQRYRDEEAAFLANMPSIIGNKAMTALKSIAATLGLDYGGIDFAVDAAGDLLFFEANATMAIVPPPADQIWNYRLAATKRALGCASAMIAQHKFQ
jgi:hypothetical protein